ncbi:MAG: exodeoxyribonuclease VII small subunit [Ruminococcaceae bacterium]|nr:exodeoxyribonuclease VII small subunit [Oscillospiraceae bacterium]
MENNYEKSLKRLEEIVAVLEEGGQPLEKTLELFSEGTALLNSCAKYLDNAEQKIITLMNGEKNAD